MIHAFLKNLFWIWEVACLLFLNNFLTSLTNDNLFLQQKLQRFWSCFRIEDEFWVNIWPLVFLLFACFLWFLVKMWWILIQFRPASNIHAGCWELKWNLFSTFSAILHIYELISENPCWCILILFTFKKGKIHHQPNPPLFSSPLSLIQIIILSFPLLIKKYVFLF